MRIHLHETMQLFEEELDVIRRAGLFRSLRIVERISPTRVRVSGKECIQFCANDYLGLAMHPHLVQAANQATERYGWGTGAARLVSGTSSLHLALEDELTRFEEAEAAVVFPSGYMTNLGTITALVGRNDLVICDRLNHASIVDACRLSGARFLVYPHNDVEALERILTRHRAEARRVLVVTDGVFSMDGDLALLPDIVSLKRRYDFILMVDEAHGTGVFGKHARGASEHFGVEKEVDVRMGTLSKAVGSIGGFVVGSRTLVDYLVNKARSFMYTTALPPAACAASIAGLRLIREQPELRELLWKNVTLLRRELGRCGMPVPPVPSPIIPIMLGEAERAVKVSDALLEEGILAVAIRPPTVPKGASRLRITVSAAHEADEIRFLCKVLRKVLE